MMHRGLLDREAEQRILPLARERGIAVIAGRTAGIRGGCQPSSKLVMP